jgi:hypothetical protein
MRDALLAISVSAILNPLCGDTKYFPLDLTLPYHRESLHSRAFVSVTLSSSRGDIISCRLDPTLLFRREALYL